MWTGRLTLISSTFSLGPRFLPIKANTLETQKPLSAFLLRHDSSETRVDTEKGRRTDGKKHKKRRHLTFFKR